MLSINEQGNLEVCFLGECLIVNFGLNICGCQNWCFIEGKN